RHGLVDVRSARSHQVLARIAGNVIDDRTVCYPEVRFPRGIGVVRKDDFESEGAPKRHLLHRHWWNGHREGERQRRELVNDSEGLFVFRVEVYESDVYPVIVALWAREKSRRIGGADRA